jgi:hypothetical protein
MSRGNIEMRDHTGVLTILTGACLLGLALASSPWAQATQLATLTPQQREILSHMSIVQLDDGLGGTCKAIRISGVNVQIVNGLGSTETTNCLGNLIVGYNELGNPSGDNRTGSHNIVGGRMNSFASAGGLVVGESNEVLNLWASVSGGARNTASGSRSSVSGGYLNSASGSRSSVSGGGSNLASGVRASISGGYNNTASGFAASVSGGEYNTASHTTSSVSGGYTNVASARGSSVSGGFVNQASGSFSSVGGGLFNLASGNYSSVGGGDTNTAGAYASSVSGGRLRTAAGAFNWVAGTLFEAN